jgi:predicted dehydrogenase
VTLSRLAFSDEPRRVLAWMEVDPGMHVDRLTSAIMEFPSGQSVFTCGTQLVPYQKMQFFGTQGRIEVEIPFNAPLDRPCRVFIDDGSDLTGGSAETKSFATCDQYTIQGDLFSRAIRQDAEVPVPLEDAVKNMAVIDALVRSVETGTWEKPEA